MLKFNQRWSSEPLLVMAMKLQNLVNRTGYLSKLKNLYVLTSKPSCMWARGHLYRKIKWLLLSHCPFFASPRKKRLLLLCLLFLCRFPFSLLFLFFFCLFFLGPLSSFSSLSIWTENNWNNLTFLLPLPFLLLLLCLHTKRLWGWSYLSFIFLIEKREDELLEIGESDAMKTDF